MKYRYTYTEEFKRINVARRGRPTPFPTEIPNAYEARTPISFAKKKDLLQLCKKDVIPREVYSWFKALPSSRDAKDRLPEPGMIDSRSDDSEEEN